MIFQYLFYLAMFILGLCVGSFLGVYVVRFSREESVVTGRSKCDHCGHQLAWWDNIPLLSWACLWAKCRYCHHSLSLFYPIIELTTGVVFVLLLYFLSPFNYLGVLGLLFSTIVACSLIVIFFADWRYGLIPDQAVVVGGVAMLAKKLLETGYGIWQFHQSLTDPANRLGKYLLQTDYFKITVLNNSLWPLGWDIGVAVLICLFFLFLVLVTKGRGMGLGDVKFSLLLGLIAGWPNSVVAVFVAFVGGALFAIGLMVLGKRRFGDTVHFGPFLVLSIPFALLFGTPLIRFYLSL